MGVAFGEVFVVVEGTVVSRDTVEVAHIHGNGTFLVGEEGLVHLLAVADADDANLRGIGCLVLEDIYHGLGLGLDGAGGGFLHEDVAILPVLEGEEHQINSLFQAHDEAGHPGLGEGDGVAFANLVYPQGDDAAARAHDVAVAGATDLGAAAVAALGHGYFLFDGLGDAHGVDGIGGFVGGEADDALDTCIDSGIEHVVGTNHVGLDGLHGEELAGGHLFEGSGMEHIIHALHGILQCGLIAYITNIEANFVSDFRHASLKVMPHVILFLFIAREYTDFAYIRAEKAVQHRIPKTPRASRNQEDFVFEY